MYRVFRVGISLSMEVTGQDIQDVTLKLHNVLTKIGIHAYVDRSLQSVIALENEVSIAFFTSRTGKAVLNIQIDCLRNKECIAELNNLVSLSNLIVKELKLITISNVEYIAKRELILENVKKIDLEGIQAGQDADEELPIGAYRCAEASSFICTQTSEHCIRWNVTAIGRSDDASGL